MSILVRALICFAVIAPAGQSHAQTWPSRPVKLVVPTGPGAATDVMARLLADQMSRSLGQPMIVENMPGASGILAHQPMVTPFCSPTRRGWPST
jgi:tripartite-type tricarboxylate transporter receptor subunit TctC